MYTDSITFEMRLTSTFNNKCSWSIWEYHYYAGDDATTRRVVVNGIADTFEEAYKEAYKAAMAQSIKL